MGDPASKGSDAVDVDMYGICERNDDRPGPSLMGASALIGIDVYNVADQELGDITEIVVDMRLGKIAYAVLSYGGFLGMGEKLFAVPWKALTFDSTQHRYRLDVTRDDLKEAPGFDKERWPNMADRTWATNVHDFYGTIYDHEDGV